MLSTSKEAWSLFFSQRSRLYFPPLIQTDIAYLAKDVIGIPLVLPDREKVMSYQLVFLIFFKATGQAKQNQNLSHY
jgi:hypothetical protein